MCGIFGYVGDKDVCKVLYQGLKSLEYRGYDSAGIAVIGDSLSFVKDAGTVDQVLSSIKLPSKRAGIAHTRWATHGKPNQINSHPHFDENMKVGVTHNGIIENYKELKKDLMAKGHTFKSQTDTEVIPHLIEDYLKLGNFEAFKKAVSMIKGSYAIVAIIDGSEKIYFARKFSPLVLGANDEYFVASDVTAFLRWTNQAIFIEDGEVGYIQSKKYYIEKGGVEVKRKPTTIEWSFEEAAKDGFDHFMLKEIFEQPTTIRNTLVSKKLEEFANHLNTLDKLVLTSAGTSYHAANAFKYASNIPIDVIVASEFTSLYRGGEILAISQSGETADTMTAVRYAKSLGSKVDALVNVVGSTLTRIADKTIYTHAGPEIGVAASKTFTAQLAALYAVDAHMKGNPLPQIDVKPGLLHSKEIKKLATKLSGAKSMFYIGRGPNYVSAMEGALKIKEISYIHAEGYQGGELKHGPLALIEKGVPVVAICPSDKYREKMIGNIEEVKTRDAYIIGIGQEDDNELKSLSDTFFGMPKTDYPTVTYAVPLQLLAYHTAVIMGRNPDKPRNLAKSVTVE
ncbi:MAG: glutamine--fructose-6-phosphate transaminase (isomerizing) [Candidatus Altiarchaeota archaeon]|nr:glutamine--fructose-6-phosphate transaminase (isomerizing) [Candidatus Altiarchaeota archaeon]